MTQTTPIQGRMERMQAWFADSHAWSRLRRARLFCLVAAVQAAVLVLVAATALVGSPAGGLLHRAALGLAGAAGTAAVLFSALAKVALVLEARGAEGKRFLKLLSYAYGLVFGSALYLAGPFTGFTWLTITTAALSVLIGFGPAPALRLLGSLAVVLFGAVGAGMAGWLPYAPLLDLPAGAESSMARFAGTLLVHVFAAAAGLLQLGLLTTLLRDRERRFRGLSSRDPLTGIANRRATLERLEEVWSRAQRYHEPLAVAIVDVDRFKDVNDRHGHPTGDLVLTHLAQILRTSLRGEDYVGRWGGEEFLVVLPLQGLVSARAALERCRVRIADEPVRSSAGRVVRVTASFGLATFPGPGMAQPQDLIAAADAALYRAKRGGRNRVECAAPGRGAADGAGGAEVSASRA